MKPNTYLCRYIGKRDRARSLKRLSAAAEKIGDLRLWFEVEKFLCWMAGYVQFHGVPESIDGVKSPASPATPKSEKIKEGLHDLLYGNKD
jgi:hypothetical protein